MASVKITLAFQIESQGWTETYILNNPVPGTLQQFNQTYAIPLAQKRAALLSDAVNHTYSRLALVGIPFAVQTFEGIGAGTYAASQTVPNVAILARCPPLVAGPNKAIYLHGFPASQLTNGFYAPSFEFQAGIAAFRQFVTGAIGNATWGWIGVNSSTKVSAPLLDYTVTTGFQVLLTFNPVPLTQTAIFQGVPIGTKIRVRLSGINGKSELNGVQVCLVSSPSEALTVYQFGVLPYSHGGKGVYEPTTFIPFGGLNDEKAVTRKTGKPLFLSVGRAKAKART